MKNKELLDRACEAAAAVCGCTTQQLLSKRRMQPFADGRSILIRWAMDKEKIRLKEIKEYLSLDHPTIYFARKRARERPDLLSLYSLLLDALGTPGPSQEQLRAAVADPIHCAQPPRKDAAVGFGNLPA